MVQSFGSADLIPTGEGLLWRPVLVSLQVGSDLLTAVSCFVIGGAIIVFLRKRSDVPGAIARLFFAVILLLGLTRLTSALVVWYPGYWLETIVKLVAGLASATMAVMLWPLIPKITRLPSRAELTQRNRQIEDHNHRLQQRVDSLGALAGGISHDFNNLLTVIKGHAQLLAQSADLSNAGESVDAISTAADRAASVCQQMLAYSGRGQFSLEETNLNDIIDKLHLPHAPQIDFNYSLSAQLHPVNVSREQIQQLLDCLCTNAIEAIGDSSEHKGTVSIRTCNANLRRAQLDKAVFLHDMEPGDAVVLEVRDNGAGMSPQVLERLFEPYYSTKFTGRGLGMAAVQGIVRGHHGCMFIDTAPAKGTTVTVVMPTARVETATYRTPRVRYPTTVLLVDDEPELLSLAREYLTSLGITALATTDPGEALRLARHHRDRLDAVIVDFLLPYTTGSELLAKITEICQVDAYLTSGYTRGEVDDPVLRKLLTGFIAKPFALEDFRELFSPGSVAVN